MTDLQWAAIAAIRAQEAAGETYRFRGTERRLAERMVKAGLLRARGQKHPGVYTVTAKGTRQFGTRVANQPLVTV